MVLLLIIGYTTPSIIFHAYKNYNTRVQCSPKCQTFTIPSTKATWGMSRATWGMLNNVMNIKSQVENEYHLLSINIGPRPSSGI
ncbi:hypothetical protein ACF0H5_009524 [Mactra antiquata]